MYARVTSIRFPPRMRAEVVGVAQGLAPLLSQQQGFNGLQVLTDPSVGEGLIVSFWETEADAEASETNSSYIGQMSMMSSFLYGQLERKTYEVNVRAQVRPFFEAFEFPRRLEPVEKLDSGTFMVA